MTRTWARAALVRAVRTAAQTAAALIGTGLVALGDVQWLYVGSVSLTAAILSILTSLGGLPEAEDTPTDSPDWDDEVGSDDLRGERA